MKTKSVLCSAQGGNELNMVFEKTHGVVFPVSVKAELLSFRRQCPRERLGSPHDAYWGILGIKHSK